jgi:hypothetical protein
MSPAPRRLGLANRRVPFAHKSDLRNTLSDLRESLLILRWFEDGQLRILTMVTGRSATVPRRDEKKFKSFAATFAQLPFVRIVTTNR